MAKLIDHSIPFTFEMALDGCTTEKDLSEEDKKSTKYQLKGIATDSLPDKQNQRFAKGFIDSMVESAIGMTCFFEHKRDLDNSIGVCKDAVIEGDDSTMHVTIDLEDPNENDLVAKIIRKSEQGVKIGLSVSGVVTKSSIEKSMDEDGKDKKESSGIQILEEGRLDEISAVGLPCNPRGWASVIMKSFKQGVNEMSDVQEFAKETWDKLSEEEKKKAYDLLVGQAEKSVDDVEEEEGEETEKAEGDDMISISQEIVSGVAGAISAAMAGLEEAMGGLKEFIQEGAEEEEKRQASVENSLGKIVERIETLEKSQYDRMENILRTQADRTESTLRTHLENAVRSTHDRTEDLVKSQTNGLKDRLEEIEKSFTVFDSDEFKGSVQTAVEEALVKSQGNPGVSRKSQGNQDFNNVEKKQEVKDRIQKDEDGQVVVDFGSIDPLSLSKSEMGKLEKSQRLQALNAGIARMMGKA
tara:strand:- start:956 stop:2362 length:1407 start_codon:yes stop_codon:yes gene_type:complete